MKSALLALSLFSLLVVHAASRDLLNDGTAVAEEHQRILAELEEVHQLRERMLQAGKCSKQSESAACAAAMPLVAG